MPYIAQTINNPALGSLGKLSATQFLGKLIPSLISLGLVIGGIVFIFMLIIGGIEWISSGGDKVKYESARKRITNALVGLIVLFSFVAIINLVECFFRIGLRKVKVGPFSIGFASTLVCGGGGGSTPDPCSGPSTVSCNINQCIDCDAGGWHCDPKGPGGCVPVPI